MSVRKEKRKERRGLVVRRSRPGRGLGLFTTQPIQKGEFVIEYMGRLIPTSDADHMSTKYLFEIDDTLTIDGSVRSNKARYINHSCRPNCEAELDDTRIYIYTMRNIKAGEELSYDYGEEYFNEFIKPHGCKCEACANR